MVFSRKYLVLAAALAPLGCASGPASPAAKTPDQLLAEGDLLGALDASTTAQGFTRQRIARAVLQAADPMISVGAIPREEFARRAGIHALRQADPSWAVVVAQGSVSGEKFGRVTTSMVISSGGTEVLPIEETPQSLAWLTGETYPGEVPAGLDFTSDIPWPFHILTVGVTLPFTVHVVQKYKPAPLDLIRAEVPRALGLASLLGQPCAPPAPCEERMAIRRPSQDDARLTLHVRLTMQPPSGPTYSALATFELPPGGRLEDRLASVATNLHLAESNATSLVIGEAKFPKFHPCPPTTQPGKSKETEVCLEYRPWPTPEISPLGLDVPAAPERLGTIAESNAARPWWTDDDVYAPLADPRWFTSTATTADSISSGIITCKKKGLRVVDDDADRLFAEVEVDRRRWTVDDERFSFPLLTINTKSSWKVSFYDGDYLSNPDHLATVTLRRKGNRMIGTVGEENGTGTWASVECEIFDRPAVEEAFRHRWVFAADALDACEEAPGVVKPADRDLGFGGTWLREARTHIENAAALVGWSDARVGKLLERYDALEARFWSGTRKAIEALPGGKTGPVTVGEGKPEGKVYGAKMRCPEPAKKKKKDKAEPAPGWKACVVDVDIENTKKDYLYLSFTRNVQLILDDGRLIDVDPMMGPAIPPGGRAVVSLRLKNGPPPPSRTAKPWRLVLRAFHRADIVPILPPNEGPNEVNAP
jgi:hypothetical protein